MFDENFVQNCAKNFILLNTARGEVVDTAVLLKYLKNGKIVAAGLDVLENEKLHTLTQEQEQIFKELTALPNVLLTPHVAGWTQESYRKISEVLAEKIEKILI
jgi:D-3-phosphoglycerate dehydrogenase